MSKISVIGAGAWGTTLAQLAAENGHKVLIWSFEKEVTDQINEFHENKKFLCGFQLSADVEATCDIKSACDCDVMLLVTPSQFLRRTLKSISGHLKKDTIVVNAAKGLELDTQKTMSQIIKEELSPAKFAVLSGPNISKEIAKGLPAAAVAASSDISIAKTVQKAMNNQRFRVYTNTDIIGVELGGTLKNVIAIAAGVADGLDVGNNAKSALLVRGIAEITRLGVAMGGKKETFSGLSGIGDLITTCMSTLSRNHFVGTELAKGKKWEEIKSKMIDVAEGVPTAKAAKILARKMNIEMPITEEVYAVLYENKDPFKAISSLMQRDLKDE
jgi:glycerol-3-phosphate dehydrogenase (NAD(P)+)